jgi:16S rRNA processing protein RimM
MLSQADELAGRDILVPADALKTPGEGMVYVHDLVGCAVETLDGRPVGRATGVEETGGPPLLVVAPSDGGDAVLVPLHASICRLIDTAGKRIVIDPPDGLLDLDAI